MIQLTEGKICIETDNKVQQPELTITERIFADSEPEAINYQKDSFVGVSADWDSLLVIGKNSLGVVSGGSGNVPTVGGSSQSAPRRETQVVLKVPVAENVEGKKLESTYIIKTNSGNIRIESVTGKYTISADAGDIVVEACNMVDSKENKAGKTKVAAATLNVSEIKNESGEIEVIGAKLNSCSIAGKTGKIAVAGGALDLSPITNESGYIEVIGAKLNSCSIAGKTKNIAVVGTILNSCAITNQAGNIEVTDGIFIGENAFNTRAGNISVKFGRGQGEIEVKASVGGHATQKLFFEGVENPNGQTARLSLTTQDGEIKVNE